MNHRYWSSGAIGLLVVLAFLAKTQAQKNPSPIIYPKLIPVFNFSHLKHIKLECLRCHPTVVTSSNTKERNLPEEAICRPCHQQQTRQSKTKKQSSNPGCPQCHRGYTGQGIPVRVIYPEVNLRFGHALHLNRQTSCTDCHSFGEKKSVLPTMSTCMSCHKLRNVSNRCVVCHLGQKDGRLKTRFASGQLKPEGTLKGDKHTVQFAHQHRALARTHQEYCESCHTRESCNRCHQGSLRPMSIHRGDYVSLHALDARRNQPRCSSCHRSQTFCLGCHQRLGVGSESSQSGFKPNTSRAFHPVGWNTYQRGAGHHSYSAKRNINTCSSCHQETTCIRCHGSIERSRGGISPHPPGFAHSRKCRSLSGRNQRVCLKCHIPGDPKMGCTP